MVILVVFGDFSVFSVIFVVHICHICCHICIIFVILLHATSKRIMPRTKFFTQFLFTPWGNRIHTYYSVTDSTDYKCPTEWCYIETDTYILKFVYLLHKKVEDMFFV